MLQTWLVDDLNLIFCLRDDDLLYLLHIIVLEQSAALEAILDLSESRSLHVVVDDASKTSKAGSGLGNVDVDALGEGFIEDGADTRHAGFGFRMAAISKVVQSRYIGSKMRDLRMCLLWLRFSRGTDGRSYASGCCFRVLVGVPTKHRVMISFTVGTTPDEKVPAICSLGSYGLFIDAVCCFPPHLLFLIYLWRRHYQALDC